MKRIVISGFYGAGNLGDEAILEAVLEHIRASVPDAEITVLSITPEQTAERYRVKSLYRGWRRHNWEKLTALRQADLLVSGGGGLLQDTYATGIISGPLPYYLMIVLLAKLQRTPVMFYAQGIGPINTTYGKLLTRLVVNQVDYITVRDEQSAQLLRQLGVKKPPVEVTADPVLALTPASPEVGASILADEGIPLDKPLVGISVRPWFNQGEHLQAVAQVADKLVSCYDVRVLYLPFEHQFDREVSEAARAGMQYQDQAYVLQNDYQPREMMALYRHLELLVGMRLHSLIFAGAMEVPAYGIIYDPKVKHLMERLGQQQYAVPLEQLDVNTAVTGIQQLWQHKTKVQRELKDNMAKLQQLALKNASILASLIEN